MPFRKLHNNFNYLVVYLTRSPAVRPLGRVFLVCDADLARPAGDGQGMLARLGVVVAVVGGLFAVQVELTSLEGDPETVTGQLVEGRTAVILDQGAIGRNG